LVDALHHPLPSAVLYDTVLDSVIDLAGEKLTLGLLWTTAFRLAGNLPRLRQNTAVPTWTSQRDKEWVPVQIIGARRRRSQGRTKKPGYLFSFQVLAGTACPLIITKFWTDGMCWKLIRDEVGFSKRTRPPKSGAPVTRMFQHPRELINMRMLAFLDPDESTSSQPGFEKIDVTPSLVEHNHLIMDMRDRIKPEHRCPKGFGPDVPCYRCYAGFESCPAGTHRKDYTFRYCFECGNSRAAFDSELKTDLCIACYEKQSMKRRE